MNVPVDPVVISDVVPVDPVVKIPVVALNVVAVVPVEAVEPGITMSKLPSI
jgi:hypothetical protein